MKKRTFGFLLVLMTAILAFALAGCKDEETPPPATYAVTYSAGEGTGTPPTGSSYAAGATFALPEATGLSKEGYRFTVWNDGIADYGAGATYTMPAKAVTFTARWEEEPATYAVTYSAGEGTGTPPTGSSYAAGATFALPEATGLSKDGSHFTVWNDGTSDYAAGATYTMPAHAVTFTARWEEEPATTYTVTYQAGNYATGADIVKENVTGGDITLLSIDEITFEPEADYYFYGWQAEGDEYLYDEGDIYTLSEDTVFVAQWVYELFDNEATVIIQLDIDYDIGALFILGEAEDGSEDIIYEFTISLDGTAITITPDGGEACTGTFDENGLSIRLTIDGTTYTFGNPVTTYTVTFNPNNADAPVTWTEEVADGEAVAKPADPTNENGKLFRYWTTEDGSEYLFDTPVTADLVLTAVYAYKVTFSAGEGTGTVEPMWVKMWNPMGITLPDGTGLTHSGGKVFGGWNDGTATYAAGDRYTGSGNHTLTAVWNDPVTEITVSFETTWRGEGTPPAPQTGKHAGDTITLPENTFTATSGSVGYVFTGWYVKGGSNTQTYQPNETYTIATDFSGTSLVFIAKWEKGKFTVTYKAGDHASGADIVKENVTGGDTFLLSAENITFMPEANYLFNGWKKEGGTEDDVYAAGDKYTLTENTVFVAQWAHAYVGYDNAYTAQIGLYFDTNNGKLYIFGEAEDGSQDIIVSLTFTLSGTAITITPDGGTACTGTFDENGLSIALTHGGKTYTFGTPATEPTEPTVTFSAGEGSGDAPTATVTYNSASGMYKILLPQNTYTAPEGKEFKCWSIGGNEYQAGKSYMAEPGDAVTVTAVWQAVAQPTFEGTVFTGNCTTPVKGGFIPGGGETYVKFIINADKTQVQYTLSDGKVEVANLTDQHSPSYMPQDYGADALYFEVKMENVAYYLLVKADMSKLSMCNSNDELLENGEFIAETGGANTQTSL